MTIPNIPDNHLTKHIEKLISLCKKLDARDYNEYNDAFIFNPAATVEEIELWESKNNVKITSSCKDWLLFSNGSKMCNSMVELYSLDNFIVDNSEKPYNVPDEYVIIGSITTSEKLYGFSSLTGKYMIFWDYEDIEVDEFEEILEDIMDVI